VFAHVTKVYPFVSVSVKIELLLVQKVYVDNSNNISLDTLRNNTFHTCFDGTSVIISVTYFEITVEFIARDCNQFATLQLQYCVHKSLHIRRTGTYKESVTFMCFTCFKVGFLLFYIHRFFKFNLKLSSRRFQELETIR